MRNRSVRWHLLSSEDINAGQSSKFPVRGRISDEFTLRIPVSPCASDCRPGLSLCSALEGEAAHTVGRGSELWLFLVSPVQLLRYQHHGLPAAGKVRVSAANGIITTIVSSPGKNLPLSA